MIPSFPKIIPELRYSSDNQLSVNKMSLKFRLMSFFFHRRVIKNDLVYLYYVRRKKLEFMPLFSLTRCLSYYNDYVKTKDELYKEKFISVAERLINLTEKRGQLDGWLHKKTVVLPGQPKPILSYSALFNARGLSVLIRLYQFKKSKKLADLIGRVLETFTVESDKGGVLRKEGDNFWYLEYSYGNKTPIVYNGFMNSLVSLWEVGTFGPKKHQKNAKNIFDKGIATLKRNHKKMIHKRVFSWFRYDSNKLFFADGNYGAIEISVLKELYNITNDASLRKVYKSWVFLYKKNKWGAGIFEWFYFVYKKTAR